MNPGGNEEAGLTRNIPTSARVRFEEATIRSIPREPQRSKIERFIINHSGGYVRNEKQVFYVVLGLFIISVLFSLYFVFGIGRGPSNKIPEAFENKPFLPLRPR